ncbi:hypothetical protein BDV19DRAFT_371750 [Aspergillus venezuelensis]
MRSLRTQFRIIQAKVKISPAPRSPPVKTSRLQQSSTQREMKRSRQIGPKTKQVSGQLITLALMMKAVDGQQ